MNSEEAYEKYRKEYRAGWYQRNKKKQNFLKWIRLNPQLKNVPDVYDLYSEHGGAKAKKIIMNRLIGG
ncbi:hypothetical protein [Halomonas salinarum]|uniref:hypothetical protein n=1 Tax=Halomonas salinarum TaxID=1158993 RepID=UPI00143B2C62|nr:hypothetical protein [Halomonas salinarum]